MEAPLFGDLVQSGQGHDHRSRSIASSGGTWLGLELRLGLRLELGLRKGRLRGQKARLRLRKLRRIICCSDRKRRVLKTVNFVQAKKVRQLLHLMDVLDFISNDERGGILGLG